MTFADGAKREGLVMPGTVFSEVAPLRAICLKKLEALRRRAETSHVTARIELLDGTPHVSLVEAAVNAAAVNAAA